MANKLSLAAATILNGDPTFRIRYKSSNGIYAYGEYTIDQIQDSIKEIGNRGEEVWTVKSNGTQVTGSWIPLLV